MDVIMDGLLIAGALFAGVYCWVLSGRVRALRALDSGLGGAIVTLTRQIELARGTLDEARASSRDTRQDLTQLVARAEAAATQLRLLLAATREPPAADADPQTAPAEDARGARRREVALPRLVSPVQPAEAAPGAAPPETPGDAPPKPGRMTPLGGVLRPRAPREAQARSEEELLAALSALAAGER